MDQFVEKALDWVSTSGISVITALLTLLVGIWVSKILTGITRRMLNKRGIEPTLVKFGTNILYAVLVVFVVTAALSKVGFQTASIEGSRSRHC